MRYNRYISSVVDKYGNCELNYNISMYVICHKNMFVFQFMIIYTYSVMKNANFYHCSLFFSNIYLFPRVFLKKNKHILPGSIKERLNQLFRSLESFRTVCRISLKYATIPAAFFSLIF